MIKKAWAVWKGGIKDGGGTICTETGVLNETPYGFKARFENGKGTNPEELIGAANRVPGVEAAEGTDHGGCEIGGMSGSVGIGTK